MGRPARRRALREDGPQRHRIRRHAVDLRSLLHAEARRLGLSNDELYDVFAEWNRGELDSYLIEITRDIFSVKDTETGDYLVDMILDTAGAKGTGKWMSQLALDLGVPSTLVTEAVYARCLSALKDAPRAGEQSSARARRPSTRGDRKKFIEQVRQALYASKICSYAQGFVQMQAAAKEHDWPLDYGNIALLWRGGCIIRARFLDRIKEAFDADPKLENLLLAPYFAKAVDEAKTPGGTSWRRPSSSACRCRPSRRPWPTTTATAASGCRPTCCKPSAITSARTPTSASTSRARSTPIGCGCADRRKQ